MTEPLAPSPAPVPEPEPIAPVLAAEAAARPETVDVPDFDGHAKVARPSRDPVPPPAWDPDVPETPFQKVLKELPYLSDFYDETYVYLVPCDPQSIYCIFEVGTAVRTDLKARFGADFFEKNSLLLRVYDVTGISFDGFNANTFFEVDDYLADKVCYWVKAAGGRDYVAEIGYRAHGTTYFEKVARSNSVFVPRGKDEPAQVHVTWGSIYAPSRDVEIPVGPDQWRYNQYLYWKRRNHAAPVEKGYWSLVLHQHLPFVRHPEYEVGLEEQWFFEAVVSVYTQLLHVLWNLERDKVDFRLTVSLTPPLLSMMQDPHLKLRAARHIDECIKLATRERDNARGKPWLAAAEQILSRFWTAKRVWDAYEGDLTRGYRDFQNAGKLEVITCPATHWILPLYKDFPEAIRAQIQTAKRQYERVFGRNPRGIWLAENAWTPGLDSILAAEGFQWFLVNPKALREGDTRPFFDSANPIITPAGTAAFPIDPETRAKIWSRENGYPGAPNYKEWYRDLGYDADFDYLPEYWKTAGVRRNTGIKYYRITGPGVDLGGKTYYVPDWADETREAQAAQFVFERGAQANYFFEKNGGRKPCVVSAYDAELFGHWWEEGPGFIESVFRKLLWDQSVVRPATPSEYLSENPHHQRMTPGATSWGKGDYFQTWVEGREYQPNTWVYRHLFRLVGKMADLATRHHDTSDALLKRALDQAARCLFLAGASDWGFLIETGQAVRYSEVQIVKHLDRARELMRQVEAGQIHEEYLTVLEDADTIFPFGDMDFRVFCRG
ncbi:MAG: DUF1957 domain-containing protein [Holophagales bacterium]|nr:DUF1957 domain-containing protein [Holophagales bacterium]